MKTIKRLGILVLAMLLLSGCSVAKKVTKAAGDIKDRVVRDTTEIYNEITDIIKSGAKFTEGAGEIGDTVSEMDIVWITGNVKLVAYKGSCVKLEETQGAKIKLRYSCTNGKLVVIPCGKDVKDLPTKDLTVYVPAALSLTGIRVEAVSADVAVTELNAGDAEIESVTGKVTVKDCAFRELGIETVSGDASCTGLTVTKKLSFESVIGNAALQFASLPGYTAKLDSVTGRFSATPSAKSRNGVYTWGDGSLTMEFETVSGNITVS